MFEELRGLVLKTVAMVEPIRKALEPLANKITLALLYGSVAKGTDTAASDIDLLVVADHLTLEDVYSALAPAEAGLDRKISPTLYTSKEFADRKAAGNAFLTRVLTGEQWSCWERTMSHPQLDNLVRIGQLKVEPAAAGELEGLVRSGIRRLDDAAREELSLESRFDLAYNAAHALALAALRHRGYRAESRYLVFQCLQHTIDLPQQQWRVLDQAHRKRNLAEYEGEMDIDEQLVAALLRVAREVATRVSNLIAA